MADLQRVTAIMLVFYKQAEVGIYKRKQELDQEKKEKFSFFLDPFFGRVLVFLFSYFLVFFLKIPPPGAK